MLRKRSVYHSLVLSYVCMLLIPIIICVAFYFYSYKHIKEQTDISNRNLIATIQKTCDREVDYYQSILLQMAYNQNANQLAAKRKYSSGNDYYQTYVFHKEMGDLNMSINRDNNYCKDNFVYLMNTNRVISANGVYSFEEYIELMAPAQVENTEQLREYVSETHFCKLTSVEVKNQEKGLLYTTSIGQYSTGQTIAVAGMWLDMDCLSYWVESSSWEEGIECLIVDSNDAVVCGTDTIELKLGIEDLSKETTVEWNDEIYNANVVASAVTDIYYILLMPQKVIVNLAGKMTRVFCGGIFFCILTGYVIAKYFAKRNYDPLKEILGHFEKKDKEKDGNEYDYLNEMIQKILGEYSDIEKTLERSKDNIKQLNLFKALLTTVEDESQVDENFSEGKNIVLLVSLFEKTTKGNEPSVWTTDLKHFIVNNVLEEAMGKFRRMELVHIGEELAIIINIREEDAEFFQKIQEVVEELQKFILDNFKFAVSVFVGTAHEGVEGIHVSYTEACKAKAFHQILEDDYINYHQISDISVKKYSYSFEIEERIVDALKNGNSEVALLSIKKVLDVDFKEEKRTPELLSCLLYDILGTLMRTAEEQGKSVDVILGMMNVTLPLSSGKIMKSFTEIVDYICKEELMDNAVQKQEISDRIYEYVLENYNDCDLNISQIGLHFDMTPSYLAKLYKQQTGDSLLKTINEIKVNKAMEYLKQGYSVVEVAERCGFRESSNLIRIFKKCTGITPGQYRSLNRKS